MILITSVHCDRLGGPSSRFVTFLIGPDRQTDWNFQPWWPPSFCTRYHFSVENSPWYETAPPQDTTLWRHKGWSYNAGTTVLQAGQWTASFIFDVLLVTAYLNDGKDFWVYLSGLNTPFGQSSLSPNLSLKLLSNDIDKLQCSCVWIYQTFTEQNAVYVR